MQQENLRILLLLPKHSMNGPTGVGTIGSSSSFLYGLESNRIMQHFSLLVLDGHNMSPLGDCKRMMFIGRGGADHR
jgi:hypothetical protein